jgi:hypothetical protein
LKGGEKIETSGDADFCVEDGYESKDDRGGSSDSDSDDDDDRKEEGGVKVGEFYFPPPSKGKGGKEGRTIKHADLLDPEVLHGYEKTAIGTRMGNGWKAKPSVIEDDVDVMGGVRKVFYAARTHSQLSQFLREIGKTKYGGEVRVVHVGGRKALCGNREVNREGRGEDRVTEEVRARLDMLLGLRTCK